MSRYVDIKWLLGVARLSNGTVDIDDIYNAPSIEIVRCRECRYWHKNRKEGDDIPVYDACYDFTDNDFCSYGEPKEELNSSERLVKGSKNPCETCANKGDYDGECKNCVVDSEPIRLKTPSHYKPKQTDCPWKVRGR